MASLDVLDHLHTLEQALAARNKLPANLRKQALKDVRRALDAMAFRFAILDERPLPEDLDYLRAIEAIKTPDKTAEVLERRQPYYAKTRRRRLVTTWVTLAILAAAIGGLYYLGTSEKATTLASFNERPGAEITYSVNRTFTVEPQVNRLHLDGSFFLSRQSQGTVDIRLIDPTGKVAYTKTYSAASNNWLRDNIYQPTPGVWTAILDYNSAAGSAQLTVDGVEPAR